MALKAEVKSTGLMIGNLIVCKGNVAKVLSLSEKSLLIKFEDLPFGVFYREIEGIPIDEIVLLKCGFEKGKKGFELTIGNDFKLILEEHDSWVVFYKVVGSGAYTTLTYIQHLHELQNLLHILGQHLTFKP